MPMPPNHPLLICVPADRELWFKLCQVVDNFRRIVGPEAMPREGSKLSTCLACNRAIWVGPNQQKLGPRPELCLVCGVIPAVEGSPTDDIPWGQTIVWDATFLEGGSS